MAGGLTLSNVPDGLFVDPDGARVAFELEVTAKSKANHQLKIQKYVRMMRSSDPKVRVFERVHFVCAKQVIVDYLVSETKVYGDLFKVESIADFQMANIGGLTDEKNVRSFLPQSERPNGH